MELFAMTPENPPKWWRKKMGVFGWEGDDLFISAFMAGMSETEATVCCAYDGEPLVQTEGTILVREEWARREKPEMIEALDAARRMALEMKRSHPHG